MPATIARSAGPVCRWSPSASRTAAAETAPRATTRASQPSPDRRLYGLQAPRRSGAIRRSGYARGVLGASTAQVLRASRRRPVADGVLDRGADGLAMAARGRGPRLSGRGPAPGEAGDFGVRCRRIVRALAGELGRIPGKSKLAEAIRYADTRRKDLVLFLHDGRVEIDSNIMERAIHHHTQDRPVRRLRRWRPNLGNPRHPHHDRQAQRRRSKRWLAVTLERIAIGWPNRQIDDLMPWHPLPAQTASAGRLLSSDRRRPI